MCVQAANPGLCLGQLSGVPFACCSTSLALGAGGVCISACWNPSACHQHTAAQGSCPRQLCCVHAATPASAWGSCVLCFPHAATPTSNCLPLLEAHRCDPMSPSAASVTSGVHSACCIPGFQLRPWLQAHHNDPTSPSAAGSRPPGLPRMPLAPTSLNTPRTGGSSMGPPGVSPSSSSAVSTLTGGHQCTSPA